MRTRIPLILVSSLILLLLGFPATAVIHQENTTFDSGLIKDASTRSDHQPGDLISNPVTPGGITEDAASRPVSQDLAILPVMMDSVSGPSLSGVPIFPADHIWNTRVDALPVDARSAAYVGTIGSTAYMHADFGSGLWDGSPIGIPYNIVNGSQAKKAVAFDYADESDPGPYPIPEEPVARGGVRPSYADHRPRCTDALRTFRRGKTG